MSFKSKQRAKHGHLFGDDPLNATLVTASDDPLFSPSKTSQSSRTSTPDPLSRSSSPSSSPLDVSNSTPIRRTTKTNNSIFGDIDVSKLGGGNGVYSSNRNNLRTTPLRSNNKQLEQDEEDLFGGGSKVRARVQSKATHIISKIIEPRAEPRVEPRVEPKPMIQEVIPTPPVVIHTTPSPQTTTEEKPSSFFASASRFFKSSSSGNNSPKISSAASSVSNVSIQSDTPAVQSTPPALPPRQSTPPAPPTRQQQQQPRKPLTPPRTTEINQEEEEEEEEVSSHVIEDEATRAFADDVISFQANYTPDYTTYLPNEMGIESLRIDNKKLLPSASTPTIRADVEDPWFDNSRLALVGHIEPSMSSPLHKVSVQDIEPQKRNAFADLINSWNTGQSKFESVQEEDHEQFFSHVAAEQGDIGFGGITTHEEEGRMKTNMSTVWDSHDEENPWN